MRLSEVDVGHARTLSELVAFRVRSVQNEVAFLNSFLGTELSPKLVLVTSNIRTPEPFDLNTSLLACCPQLSCLISWGHSPSTVSREARRQGTTALRLPQRLFPSNTLLPIFYRPHPAQRSTASKAPPTPIDRPRSLLVE